MKIALIAPTYIPARRANTIQVMKMAQTLDAAGHQVRVAVPGLPPGRDHTVGWEELAHQYGLERRFPIEWLPAIPQLRRYDYGYRAVRWARHWQASLIYTRLPQAAALASQRGLATILEIHDLPQGLLGPWLFRRFLKGRGARRLVVITHALVTELARRFGIPEMLPFTVIAPDGVDLDRYASLPEPAQARRALAASRPILESQKTLPPEAFTAGYTGHLYAGRGAELVLSLAERLPDIHFLLAGGEPQEVAHLRAEAAARNLGNVILTGFVPNTELPAYQAACDVLLMPYQQRVAASSGGDISRFLSPMKLFEYLACGRAILSSDLPVLQEVLTPQNAMLLPPDDVDAWAAALRGLQAQPEHRARLAEQARCDAAQYTWAARVERILHGIQG